MYQNVPSPLFDGMVSGPVNLFRNAYGVQGLGEVRERGQGCQGPQQGKWSHPCLPPSLFSQPSAQEGLRSPKADNADKPVTFGGAWVAQ